MNAASDVVSSTIRTARAADAGRIALLSGQLGYPATAEDVRRRLRRLDGDTEHAVYVAVEPGGEIVAWFHIHLVHLIESDTQAEVSALVVDATRRSQGIGRLLMQQAEQWARAKGCRSVRLRSRITRERAHAFFEELGYNVLKTQKVFVKKL